jgi:hypothetical protein
VMAFTGCTEGAAMKDFSSTPVLYHCTRSTSTGSIMQQRCRNTVPVPGTRYLILLVPRCSLC